MISSLCDHIWCISLKNRTDKQEWMQKFAAKYQLELDFYLAEKHPDGGVVGCFESHQQVCRLSLERGYKRILILEDDVEATSDFENAEIWNEIKIFLKQQDPVLFYLGGVVMPMSKSLDMPNTKYMKEARLWTTHAYFISEPGMQWLIKQDNQLSKSNIWPRGNVDYEYAYYSPFRQYYTYPFLLNQTTQLSSDVSDANRHYEFLSKSSAITSDYMWIFISLAILLFMIICFVLVWFFTRKYYQCHSNHNHIHLPPEKIQI